MVHANHLVTLSTATEWHALLLQESKRLLSTVLSIQPGTTQPAGAAGPAGPASVDSHMAQLVSNILANLPASLSREDASVAKDPFAPLPSGQQLAACL